MRRVHVVVPSGIDDPTTPSGGNVYDRRICDGLGAVGWDVTEHKVDGGWPWPDDEARRALDRVIADLPDGAVMLIDGLIASTVPAVLVPHAQRLVAQRLAFPARRPGPCAIGREGRRRHTHFAGAGFTPLRRRLRYSVLRGYRRRR